MATVVGLFNDYDTLQKALGKLEGAGLADDIVETLDQSEQAAQTEEVMPPAGGAMTARGVRSAPLAINFRGAFNYLDKLGEAGEFFKESVQDGGRLVILETKKDEEAMSILADAGAEHTDSSARE
jgi:hypothetical protein